MSNQKLKEEKKYNKFLSIISHNIVLYTANDKKENTTLLYTIIDKKFIKKNSLNIHLVTKKIEIK